MENKVEVTVQQRKLDTNNEFAVVEDIKFCGVKTSNPVSDMFSNTFGPQSTMELE